MNRLVRAQILLGLVLALTFSAAALPQAQQPGKGTRPAPQKPVAAPADPLAGLDAFVTGVMQEWKLPGLAIAIVKDGQVIHAKGYGQRDVEGNQPVTPQTLFAIGSISKSFTVTALGILVDEKKVEWDKPVRDYVPEFQLHDAVASERMTVRDLVTHRSGLPRHDLLWYGSGFTRQQMLERLRFLEPSRDFRQSYQYQNLMFMTAGIVVERVSGMKWEQFVRQRVLEPLGMGGSNFSVNDSQRTSDFALPYVKVREEVRRTPFRNIDEIGPAGSINSSVEMMARYILFHLNKGKVGDKQVLSEANSAAMQTPQMVMPGPMQYDEVFHSAYGMGLGITAYRGRKLVSHGGGIDGFIAGLTFMPRNGLGVIILTNLSGVNPATQVVAYNVYDRLLGLEPIDWTARIKEQMAKQRAQQEEERKKKAAERKTGTQPSHALADYAGEFQHPGYGSVRVELDGGPSPGGSGPQGGALRLRFNSFEAALEHFHYDVFEAVLDPRSPEERTRVTFLVGSDGTIDRVAIPLESNVKDIVFTRPKPPAKP